MDQMHVDDGGSWEAPSPSPSPLCAHTPASPPGAGPLLRASPLGEREGDPSADGGGGLLPTHTDARQTVSFPFPILQCDRETRTDARSGTEARPPSLSYPLTRARALERGRSCIGRGFFGNLARPEWEQRNSMM